MLSWNEEMQGSEGSIPQYKSGTCAEGTEMIQKTQIWRSRRKHESNAQQKEMGKLQKQISREAKYVKLKYSDGGIKQEWYTTVGNDRKMN